MIIILFYIWLFAPLHIQVWGVGTNNKPPTKLGLSWHNPLFLEWPIQKKHDWVLGPFWIEMLGSCYNITRLNIDNDARPPRWKRKLRGVLEPSIIFLQVLLPHLHLSFHGLPHLTSHHDLLHRYSTAHHLELPSLEALHLHVRSAT